MVWVQEKGVTRRELVRWLLAAGAAVGRSVVGVGEALGGPSYPFKTLGEAMASAGFDPRRAASFTAAFAADVHYGHGDPERLLPPIAAEVKAMEPPPAFFGVVGDLICSASLSFGQVPGAPQKQKAIEEFKLVRKHLSLFEPRVPVKLALGNHDTYPGEDEPKLFHTVFPEHPEYHAFTIQGVHFVFLNGGSSGLLDAEQMAWFKADVAKHHKRGATLMVVVHQPSLGSVVAERGIPAAMRHALSECEGDLWMIAGHAHRNHDACFKLPKAVIVQATVTAGNPAIWGSEHPGYWVYCFREGKLVARIYKRLGQGYRVASPPPLARAAPIRLPFEGRTDVLWKVLVGEGDEPYRVETKAAWCLNYWHYNRHLVYAFPLSLAGGQARRFALLERPSGRKPRKYLTSPDGKAWHEVAAEQLEREGSFTSFAIPKDCLAAGRLFVRIEQCVVSGFALTR